MLKIQNGELVKHVFTENCVPVCFSANNSYIPQTAVMVKSIIENSSSDKNYDIIILSTDIDEVNENIIVGFASGHDNVSIRIVDISSMLENVQFFTESVYTPTTYSKEAYFRLFIPFAMPDYDRVIYFDGDMVAITDVSELMDIDMTDYVAAATRDFCGIAACYDESSGRLEYRREIGIKDMDSYFISSMVIVNIEKLNELYTLDDLKNIISSRNWRQHDQDIFNVLCQDKLLIIDARWSFFEEYDYSLQWLPEYLAAELLESSKNPAVIHYAGANKAWQDERSSLTSYFWKYAKMTPYFDEFFAKVGHDSVSYKYHIFKCCLDENVDYCDSSVGRLLVSPPYYLGYINNLKVCVEHIEIKNSCVYMDGYYEVIDALGTLRLSAFLNDEEIAIDNDTDTRRYGSVNAFKPKRSFGLEVKINKWQENKLRFALTYDGVKFFNPYYVSVEQFAPINEYGYSFYSADDIIMTKRDGTVFDFEPYSKKKIMDLNNRICKHLQSHKNKYFTKMAMVRWLYYFTKKKNGKKNICLVSDTRDEVDEDCISFVRNLERRDNVTVYLVISRECKNAKEVKKKLGCVITAQSKKHKFLFLHAKMIITSDYYMPFMLPVYSRTNEIRDMVANKKIVYWHKRDEDLSGNNKEWHNVSKFLVFSDEVFRDMLSFDNGYEKENLRLFREKNTDKIADYIIDYLKKD